MDTMSKMRGAAAAVSGARHTRIGRNGQDAAAMWLGTETGAVVVCDGCGSGASSEVGARLGAQLVIGALAKRLASGESCEARERGDVPTTAASRSRGDVLTTAASCQRGDVPTTATAREAERGDVPITFAFWDGVRAEVVATLDALVRAMPGPRERVVHDYFLFTIVAAVAIDDRIAVWVLGDGAYAIDDRVRELGPFPDNQPPYLAYDLLGDPQPAHLEVARGDRVVVATDGVAEIGLHVVGAPQLVRHPDALRRQLAVLARTPERVDWDQRRVIRESAPLQDDGAVAILERAP
jgi:hypothetical protein